MKKEGSKLSPSGISDFKRIATENYAYVDKTQFIEKMENESNTMLYLVRPRGFGKTLLLSTLQYYYDIKEKKNFNKIFGNLYIGKHPTKERNSYAILKFDFSGLDATDRKSFDRSFTQKVKESVCNFLDHYRNIFKDDTYSGQIENDKHPDANNIVDIAIQAARSSKIKITLLIDNYDSFVKDFIETGEFTKKKFDSMELAENCVTRFYEHIGKVRNDSPVCRTFITGEMPAMFDYLSETLCINNLGVNPEYNEMPGFTSSEVWTLIAETVDFPHYEEERLEKLYSGYLFSADSRNKIFSPAMALLYVDIKVENVYSVYPIIINENLLSKYKYLQRLIQDDTVYQMAKDIIKNNGAATDINSALVKNRLSNGDYFISLLYYSGLLTVGTSRPIIPNYAARCVLNNYIFDRRHREHPKKIIFLDIDGVLQPYTQYRFDHINEVDELYKQLYEEHGIDYSIYDRYDVTAVYYDWDKKSVAELKRILDVTGAGIVLSSDWRGGTLDRMVDFCSIYGFGDALVGATPVIRYDDIKKSIKKEEYDKYSNHRSLEIIQYVEAHPQIKNYVAIDDMNLVNDLSPKHAIQTRRQLTKEDADKCIKLLKQRQKKR